MNIIKLKLSMIFTLAIIFGLSTLAIMVIMNLLGFGSLWSVITVALAFNVLQWLFSPYLIDLMYGVHELRQEDAPWLHKAVERICEKSGLKKPRLMISNLDIPNAFAYGSPITGNKVAVTEPLLNMLNKDELKEQEKFIDYFVAKIKALNKDNIERIIERIPHEMKDDFQEKLEKFINGEKKPKDLILELLNEGNMQAIQLLIQND